jgi:hypothetical protein
MDRSLDLLLIESHPGVAARTAEQLDAEGHRVHRCHDGDGSFPCSGVTEPSRCPVDRHVDAAVLVRRGVGPTPTAHEDGVPCALRAGLPVVEEGTDVLDPYRELLTTRVQRDERVSDACLRAIDEALQPAAEAVLAALAPVLEAHGEPADSVSVQLSARADRLRIEIDGAAANGTLGGRLAVTAADTVRARRRRWSSVSVALGATADGATTA